MSVEFFTARNGDVSCTIDGRNAASSYNPVNEAKTFVSSLECSFNPSCILIIEPALSYCAPFLRERFNVPVYAIRLFSEFVEYDSLWDKVIYFNSERPLSEDLYNHIGEEKLCSALFLEWRPACQCAEDKLPLVWSEIKASVEKSRSVLVTRSYFSQRWLKNSANFLTNVRKLAIPSGTSLPVVIACSGPSLKDSLKFISRFRNRMVLTAVSSALQPLLNDGITPDLVISTDGGYWAKKHLSSPGTDTRNLVYAVSCEGACPYSILKNNPVIPLSYDDGFEKKYFPDTGIDFFPAKRNGTVSGTALELALNLTDDKVFLCGLDLAPAPGFQHTQPNALEKINAVSDNRIKSSESRISGSRYSSSSSLDIYRNWFVSFSDRCSERVFRLSDNFSYASPLGKIKDVNWKYFEENCRKEGKFEISIKEAAHFNGRKILESIKEKAEGESFLNDFFPLENVVLKKNTNQAEREIILNKIREKNRSLFASLERIFSGN